MAVGEGGLEGRDVVERDDPGRHAGSTGGPRLPRAGLDPAVLGERGERLVHRAVVELKTWIMGGA